MELSGHTVLVTGATSGIGRALAARFLLAGSDVVICGRRADKLREARTEHPAFHTRVCDVADPSERTALIDWVVREFPKLDVVVNNAGIQRRVDLTQPEPWEATHPEIQINFEAQVHLCSLLIPHLRRQTKPAIINVTSGLAMVPLAAVPIYSATKAAFHSFTVSLRRQLANTPISVIEVAPPAVNTDLGGPGRHTFGVPLNEFADHVIARLCTSDVEITYRFSHDSFNVSRKERDEIFERMNQARPQEAGTT